MRILSFVLLAGLSCPHALAVSSFADTDFTAFQHGRKEMPSARVQTGGQSPTAILRDLPTAEPTSPPQHDRRYNAEQHLKAVADSKRLAELANELEADLERAGDDVLPATAFRKADEIAKLAKSVKERLKPR